MVTFRNGTMLEYLPTEIKVVPFQTRLKRCRNCQEYEPVQSICCVIARRGRCSQEGHEKTNLQRPKYCFHYREQHEIVTAVCATEIYERKVIKTQENHKVESFRAKQIMEEGYMANM